MQIDVYFENIYGNKLCYPYCDDAKTFASISGHKTLTRETVAKIKRLGYSINEVIPNSISEW